MKNKKEPRSVIFTTDGYKIVRDDEPSSIPMKSTSKGYFRRKGYEYSVYRPDGSRVQTKAMSQEDARKIAFKDRR